MTLLIDTLILALLAGTLGYAFLVDRRVRGLMHALRDLQPIVGEFSAAVDKSESSVAALRHATDRMDEPVIGRSAPVTPQPSSRAAAMAAKPDAAPTPTQQAPTQTAPAPSAMQSDDAEPRAEAVFSSRRATENEAFGASRVANKSDMVRGFFEAIRAREA